MKKSLSLLVLTTCFLSLSNISYAKLTQKQQKEFSKISNIKAKAWHKLDYKTQGKFLDLYMKSLPEEVLESIITKEQFELLDKYKSTKYGYYNMKLATVVLFLSPCMRNSLAPPIEELENLEKIGFITTIKVAADKCMQEGRKANNK